MLQRYYQLHNTNKYFALGVCGTLVLIAVFHATQQEYVTASIEIAVLLVILAMFPLLSRWHLRSSVRYFTKSPFWNQKYRIELSQEGQMFACPMTESRSSWSSFTSARQFEDGIVLFQGQLMHWLPFDTLIEGTVEETEELIEPERLRAIPWTRLSIEGAEIRESLTKRYAR